MTIEILVYPALVFLAVTLAAKFIERESDVLYGPYIQGRKTALDEMREQFAVLLGSLGLRREYGRFAVKFAGVGIFASTIIG